jgi:hypothetical protein
MSHTIQVLVLAKQRFSSPTFSFLTHTSTIWSYLIVTAGRSEIKILSKVKTGAEHVGRT